ncbi:MAG: SH3 domain-containing protein [Elainellaceae cyanobacterium]
MKVAQMFTRVAWSVGFCLSLMGSSAVHAQEVSQLTDQTAAGNSYAIELQETTVCSVITGDNVNIRQRPGTESVVVTQLNQGDSVRAVFRQGDWVRLTARVFGFPSDGQQGPFDGWVVFEPLDGWVFNQFIDGCLEDADRWRTSDGAATGAEAVQLDSGGLQLVAPSPSSLARPISVRSLPFGRPDSEVVAVLTELRGEPASRGVNPECGAGPLSFTTWADGFGIVASEGRFVGWSVDGRDAGAERLTTANGIRVGLPRRELDRFLDAEVRETTLGFEFFEAGLGGILSGGGPDAEITLLYSGTTCFFR